MVQSNLHNKDIQLMSDNNFISKSNLDFLRRNLVITSYMKGISTGIYRLNHEVCENKNWQIRSKLEWGVINHENDNGEIIVPDANNFYYALKLKKREALYGVECEDLITADSPRIYICSNINPENIEKMQYSNPEYYINEVNVGSKGSFLFFSLLNNEIEFLFLVHDTVDLIQVAATNDFLNICCPMDTGWNNFEYSIDYKWSISG